MFCGSRRDRKLNCHFVIGIYKRNHPLLEGISFLSFAVESSEFLDHNQ